MIDGEEMMRHFFYDYGSREMIRWAPYTIIIADV